MSRVESQAQWDYPYGWAPIQLLAVEGMRRYGFTSDANRVAYNFLSMVIADFVTDKFIREKYNVVKRTSETRIVKGYSQNVIGFGWTNRVFLELLNELPPPLLDRLKEEQARNVAHSPAKTLLHTSAARSGKTSRVSPQKSGVAGQSRSVPPRRSSRLNRNR